MYRIEANAIQSYNTATGDAQEMHMSYGDAHMVRTLSTHVRLKISDYNDNSFVSLTKIDCPYLINFQNIFL